VAAAKNWQCFSVGLVPHVGQITLMPTGLTCSLEWELPEARAVRFAPSPEDAMPVRMNDGHCRLGENDCAIKVSKWAQAGKGMREGWHHVALHCCRGKGWGRGKSRAGNRSHREAICNLDTHGRSLRVQISNRSIGHKINTAGARVGNASVGGWKVGGITDRTS
jgi:hypothetical protein